MDRDRVALAAALVVLLGAWWWLRRRSAALAGGGAETVGAESEIFLSLGETLSGAAAPIADFAEEVVSAVTPGPWEPPARAAPYLGAIYDAEQNGDPVMPHNLLARVLYQESHFREDIITGRVVSRAGAVGIAQLMPATAAAYGVDPRDPWASIRVAAAELRQIYRRFGSWPDAVASYNWGQGNWNAFLRTGLGAKGQERPQENINYLAEIARDLGLT